MMIVVDSADRHHRTHEEERYPQSMQNTIASFYNTSTHRIATPLQHKQLHA